MKIMRSIMTAKAGLVSIAANVMGAVEAAGVWILATGSWNDAGAWDDGANWKDAP